jgi:P27 family predicted phage terminase small subunit
MAMPRKSDELHALHGTKPETPKTVASAIPAGRPKFCGPKEVRGVFKKICQMLEQRRALTEADGPLLALYCVSYSRAQKANDKLREEGEVCLYTRLDSNGTAHQVEKPNLWLKVAQDAEKQMLACLDRLGLSPMNRDRVRPTSGDTSAKVIPGSMADLYGASLEGLRVVKPRTVVPAPTSFEETEQ